MWILNNAFFFSKTTFLYYSISVALRNPENETVLIEGVLFRARYLGSTQLISEGQPSKAMRMMQAQEAVGRIKVSVYNISTREGRITIDQMWHFCAYKLIHQKPEER